MTEFHKTIIFTKTPLKGYFRYKDLFQVYPADLINMPKSNLQEHHPAILEYTTTEDDKIEPSLSFELLKNLNIHIATTLAKEDQILNLLSLFANNLFFRYKDLTGSWGMPILKDDPGEEANKWSSKWIMKFFQWPELAGQLEITEFTNLNLPEVPSVRHFEYYLNDPNFDFHTNKEITFPKTIYWGLHSYYSLDKDTRKVVDSAISHSVSAMELRQHKKTLSIIASFLSIETMVNFEYKDLKYEKCNECGQLKYKVSKKFRDYLYKYIGKSVKNKKKFNAFYSLRSKRIHTGEHIKTEQLWTDLPEDEKTKELLTHIEILQLGKMSIIHWLIKNN